MAFDEINKKLIYQAVESGEAIIPTPEELKEKFGHKHKSWNPWEGKWIYTDSPVSPNWVYDSWVNKQKKTVETVEEAQKTVELMDLFPKLSTVKQKIFHKAKHHPFKFHNPLPPVEEEKLLDQLFQIMKGKLSSQSEKGG